MQRFAAIVLLAALVTGACSADPGFEPAPLPNADSNAPQPAEGSAETVEAGNGAPSAAVTGSSRAAASLNVDAGGLVDGPVDATTAAAVTSWFDSFLSTRDRFYLGNASTEELGGYLSDRDALFAANERQQIYLDLLAEESIVASENFASFSNPENMIATRGRVSFQDCTEQQSLSTLGFVGFRWISHEVLLTPTADSWTIAELKIVHDGEPWTAPYGCTPDSFDERAVAVAERLMAENQALQLDPQALSAASFAMLEAGPARDTFANAIEEQRSQGLAIVSGEELRFDVRGLDVAASLLGWVVAVDVCAHRPDGVSYTVDDNDEVLVDTTIEPGFSLLYRVSTLLDQVEDGAPANDQIRSVEVVETSCW